MPLPLGAVWGEGLTSTAQPSICFILSLTLRAPPLVPHPAGGGKSLQTEEKPLAIAHERLSGELLGLTCVLAVTFGKKVSQ